MIKPISPDVLRATIIKWGEPLQMVMVIEEATELNKEICKWLRGRNNKDELTEEVADLLIMLQQLLFITGITSHELQQQADLKIERIKKALKGGEE